MKSFQARRLTESSKVQSKLLTDEKLKYFNAIQLNILEEAMTAKKSNRQVVRLF